MAIKLRLKDRLIHLFRQPVLLLSANCGGRRSSRGRKEKKSSKKEIRVRENGTLYMTGDKADQEGRTCPPTSPSSPSFKINHDHYYYFKEEQKNGATKQQKKMKKKKEMMMTPRSKRCELFSSSAMESVGNLGFFSSHEERQEEEEEEANKEEDIETFFSSRSFFSDSDFYKKAKKMKSSSRRPLRRRREKKSRCIWVNDGFQPLVSISRRKEEEKKEASFAVTKKSSDPYRDFQSSMVEMIVERQIFGARELQWLLHSYLSLNSVQNHPVILRAFVDISQVLFGY
ncbi:hypothetical protein M5K25_021376 [Dendrobium thyrsiflorum]|uniref:Transcription repressor n=1 Tax=Dendrobium thyrsiflorum TaxID=117978 RepID=A0ABD0UCA8_DENTH